MKIVLVKDWPEEKWADERKLGIGGSDAGTILGINGYNSPYEMWGDKTGINPRAFTGNAATWWGHKLEDIVAERYAIEQNAAVVIWPVMVWDDNGFEFANIDNLIVTPSEQFPAGQITEWISEEPPPGILAILEIKTTGIATSGTAHKWKNGQVPDTYTVQGYHYANVLMPLLPEPRVVFAALLPGQGDDERSVTVRTLGVRKDDDLLWDETTARGIRNSNEEFWNLVQFRIEPEIDGSSATTEAITRRYPKSSPKKEINLGAEFVQLWDDYQLAKKETAKAQDAEKKIRNQINAEIRDGELVFVNLEGETVLLATYANNKPSWKFDLDNFKTQHPEIYNEYLYEAPGARVLRATK